MPLDVTCPHCGARLKAPEAMAGKRGKCKQCGTSFRIPGPKGPGDSIGEAQMLSTIGTPAPPLPPEESSMVAPPVEPPAATGPTAPPPPPPTEENPFAFDTGPPAPPRPARRLATHKSTPDRPADDRSRANDRPRDETTDDDRPRSPDKRDDEGRDRRQRSPSGRDDNPFAETPVASVPNTPSTDDNPFAFDTTKPTPRSSGQETSHRRDGDSREDDQPRTPRRRQPNDQDNRERSRASDKRDGDEFRDQRDRPDRDDEPERKRYIRPNERPSGNKSLILAAVLGLAAIGTAIAAVLVMQTREREREEAVAKAKAEKAPPAGETTPAPLPPPPPSDPPAIPPKSGPAEAVLPPKGPPAREQPPKKTNKEPDAITDLPVLELPTQTRSLSFRPLASRPELVQRPTGMPLALEAPLGKVRRVFVPANRTTSDIVVAWASAPTAGGRGETITVDVYSGMTGRRVHRFDYASDGGVVKCDVSADGKGFVAARADGTITVWSLGEKVDKLLDGFDPYAADPDHKKAGIGAVFFGRTANQVIVVTTAGFVHVYELAGRRRVASSGPYGPAVPGKVYQGRNVAADESRSSLIFAVSGDLYQADAASLNTLWRYQVKADFGKPLAIGLAPGGRTAFAFETVPPAQKDKAILFCLPKGQPEYYRWPESVGDPVSISWAGPDYVVIGTTRGVVWAEYDSESKRFSVLAFGDVPGGTAVHTTTEQSHFYLLPTANGARSLLLELAMPPGDLVEFRNTADAKQPLYTVRLDDKGLSR